ncbi:hypothetical protein BGW36DRAFT_293299 [Talaromyces proteolyticus]|uniref:Zn(2)-C6 fungal-type domain-containing protein n=1 Tax=Talaromyces proteolyticus TaxID=1131652 RepID=A0AAD4PWX5_9EURO|nr:uncharacterized protein BGW36DRAFT_293299 [Talaromyces proteolyticus]KAH8698667.1 hypothetical protein BGW36DRAFT_293299 [Talaromyces proteolyticus]
MGFPWNFVNWQNNEEQEFDVTAWQWSYPILPALPGSVNEADLDGLPQSAGHYDLDTAPLDPSSCHTSADTFQDSLDISREAYYTQRRPPRRQNHSCDQCRSSKKACDLSINMVTQKQKQLGACSTCKVRGLDCTTTWLAKRQSALSTRKRMQPISAVPATDPGSSTSTSTRADKQSLNEYIPPHQLLSPSLSGPESDLARHLEAKDACLQRFNLYVDIFDMPVSQCLLQGSMPPCYSSGIAASVPLGNSSHMATYLNRADRWIQCCSDANLSHPVSMTVRSQTFRTVRILDALFQDKAISSSRDAAITETYKWVAIATSAQFAVCRDSHGLSPNSSRETRSKSRDFAYATWRMARQMVFGNIAAVSSFRYGVSSLIFGFTQPPKSGEDDSTMEQDAFYSRNEGIRRLQILCILARKRLRTEDDLRALPPHVKENIRELIGSVEWLVEISKVVTTVLRSGVLHDLYPADALPTNTESVSNIGEAVSTPNNDKSPCSQEMFDSILVREKTKDDIFVTQWRDGVCEDTLLQKLRELGALTIVLWKSLANLAQAAEKSPKKNLEYAAIHRLYSMVTTTIDLWRSNFGTFDGITTAHIQNSSSTFQNILSFCSNDGNLAVMIFYDIIHRLETHLQGQPSTVNQNNLLEVLRNDRSYHKMQRLLSARDISTLASIFHGVCSPGFQGKDGLKAYVQDIASHPYPIMPLQAHMLAAKAFSEEVQGSIAKLDMNHAADMTAEMNICLQALRGLQETLVTCPDMSYIEY